MFNREEKEALVKKVHGKLKSAQAIFLLDYRGLKVEEINDLRRKLREVSSELQVVKNTLLKRAATGTQADALAEHFSGPMALTLTEADPVAPAKVLTEFSKGVPHLEIRAGLLEGRLLEIAEIRNLASLPSFPELRAKLLSTLQAPSVNLVRLLAAPGSQLARAVSLRQEQLSAGQGGDAGASAGA